MSQYVAVERYRNKDQTFEVSPSFMPRKEATTFKTQFKTALLVAFVEIIKHSRCSGVPGDSIGSSDRGTF